MFVRLLNIGVIAALVLAAAYVYDIKYQSTLWAERVAKLRHDLRRERDAIATLRAEWARLGNPARIQSLAQRHLELKPFRTSQIDTIDHLPMKPPQIVPPNSADPIAAMLENIEETATGSIPSAVTSGKGDKLQ
jgi:cell division protein FtsL